jgi:hypothetical protein
MNLMNFNQPQKNPDPGCSDLLSMAERELAAFVNAVTELFGSEQAELSAKDWMHELMAIAGLPASTREWRSITHTVSARLASRVTALSISI